ncbi:MAG: hypothetical protein HWN81_08215 [Candidatus Lokiarchaeota archaeon]|nr:hypothetical protein [Candidatus Lokiarchaeota archaeon]
MDDFLRKLQLSENAIEIYLKSLRKIPLTYYELYSIVPKTTPEEFNKSISELLDAGLITQQPSKKQETITHYLTLPPILPILNYYNSININLGDIKNSIQELMINSVNEIFQENKTIELDSILQTFQEIRNDIDEDSIIQKQEVEDVVEGMEELNTIKQKLSILHQKIISITQTQFADLIKTLNSLKNGIIENINSMDFKKHKEEIISLIEQQFKEKLENMVEDFINNLHELIENEFDETGKPVENSTDLIIQYQNDFKMLLLNMLSNFETKMNKIHDLLKENQENLFAKMKNLEIKIAENLNAIIQNSINEVSNLNRPIEKVLKNYLQEISTIDKFLFNKIWIINSVTKINEAIQHLIVNSKENLTIVIPYLENHLAPEQFDNITSNLKIKIASSEAHTNSMVKNFKDIKNIIYRTYQNKDLVVLKSDNKQLIMGVIQDSKNPLEDFIGIGTTFDPLIKLLDPLIQDAWEKAYSDSFHGTQMVKTQPSMTTTTPKALTTAKPIVLEKTESKQVVNKPTKIENKGTKPKVSIPSQIQEIPKEDTISKKIQTTQTPSPTSTKPQITDLKQKLQEKIDFISVAQPKADDEAGMLINIAFTNLINKLDNLKGDEFGKELQNIADLILEKKGFSVTLHKVRSTINKHKDKLSLLDNNDKKEILEDIQSWKNKIF